jgi:AbrB family transcriptional regulator (stage V sporulation protein T)
MRKMLNIRVGSKLEIGIVDNNKFLLSKYSDIVSLKEYSDSTATAIAVSVEHDVLISEMEKVLSSSKRKYINKDLSEEVQELIYKKEIVIKKQEEGSEMLEFFPNTPNEFCCQLIVPIIKDGDALGAIIILASENKCFDDSSVKICKAFAKYLSDQIS